MYREEVEPIAAHRIVLSERLSLWDADRGLSFENSENSKFSGEMMAFRIYWEMVAPSINKGSDFDNCFLTFHSITIPSCKYCNGVCKVGISINKLYVSIYIAH